MRAVFIILAVLINALPAAASTVFPAAKTFLIEGVIQDGNILETGRALLEISSSSRKSESTLIINSPGGDVITGFRFINMMEAAKRNGMTITCVVPEIAASMAFGILVHCNRRFILSNGFVLWHRARVFASGVITSPIGRNLANQLNILDRSILEDVLKAMPGADQEAVKSDFEAETLHTGHSVELLSPKFAHVVDSIPGLYETHRDLVGTVRGRLNRFQQNSIIYISERFLRKGQ